MRCTGAPLGRQSPNNTSYVGDESQACTASTLMPVALPASATARLLFFCFLYLGEVQVAEPADAAVCGQRVDDAQEFVILWAAKGLARCVGRQLHLGLRAVSWWCGSRG